MAVLGGVPAEVELARLRVVQLRVALAAGRRGTARARARSAATAGSSLIAGCRSAPIVFAAEAERLALSMKTIMTTRWSRMSMIFCFVAVSLKGARAPSKWSQPYVGGSLDLGLAVLVPRDDPALGLERLPERPRPSPGPNASRNLCFSTSTASGPEPLAGGQVQEVAQQVVLRSASGRAGPGAGS